MAPFLKRFEMLRPKIRCVNISVYSIKRLVAMTDTHNFSSRRKRIERNRCWETKGGRFAISDGGASSSAYVLCICSGVVLGRGILTIRVVKQHGRSVNKPLCSLWIAKILDHRRRCR